MHEHGSPKKRMHQQPCIKRQRSRSPGPATLLTRQKSCPQLGQSHAPAQLLWKTSWTTTSLAACFSALSASSVFPNPTWSTPNSVEYGESRRPPCRYRLVRLTGTSVPYPAGRGALQPRVSRACYRAPRQWLDGRPQQRDVPRSWVALGSLEADSPGPQASFFPPRASSLVSFHLARDLG